MRQFQVDRLRVTVSDTREEMGRRAAEDGGAYLRELLGRKALVNVVFAAAPSQNECLAALLREKGIDWTRVRAFHMDEYVGLPRDGAQTFAHYLRTHLFDPAPFHSVHYIGRCGDTAEEQCRAYRALLREHPIDAVFLGVGENGHIAFNDPGTARFDDPETVKIVPLDDVCRAQQVHDGCFPTLEDVPTHAITLTVPALCSAGCLFCVVPGTAKAEAVRRMLEEEISERCPASILRRHGGAALYLDRQSAGRLGVEPD